MIPITIARITPTIITSVQPRVSHLYQKITAPKSKKRYVAIDIILNEVYNQLQILEMLQKSRQRRMKLQQNIEEKSRLSSAQRRRRLESNLNSFKNTLYSFPKSNFQKQTSQKNSSSPKKEQASMDPRSKYNNMKDLTKQIQKEQIQAKRQESQNQSIKKQDVRKFQDFIPKQQMIKPSQQKSEKSVHFDILHNQSSKPNVFDLSNSSHKPSYSGQKSPNNMKSALYSQNSSGIFFTSQFREYINRNQQKQQNQHVEQIPLQQNQEANQNLQTLRFSTQTDCKKLSEKSQKSLHSNQSSLKLSINQSGLHDNLHKKLGVQLVLDRESLRRQEPIQIEKKHQDKDKQEAQRTLKKLAVNYLQLTRIKQWEPISRKIKNTKNLLEKIKKIMLKVAFEQLLVYEQYCFNLQKTQIQIRQFRKKYNDLLLKIVFKAWKDNTITRILDFIQKKKFAITNNVFRVLKMYWYDKRVQKQIDMYYLSKIFNHMKLAIAKQAKNNEKKALKFHYKWNRRKFFKLFIQGIQHFRMERQKNEIAEDHYRTVLLSKCLLGWSQKVNQQGKYISLAMTTKDEFRQTKDHKWLQTKTIDFKQIKL